MSPSAKVTSIDAVQAFMAALQCFHDEASNAMEESGMQVRRAKQWVQDDQRKYWERQVRLGWEKVAEARVQLQQAKTFRRIGDYRPSCDDEKKALEAAKRRLRFAEEKVEVVRHWSRAVEHAVSEFRGEAGPLAAWLEVDVPQAIATLRRLTEALDTYVAIRSAPEASQAASLLPGEGGVAASDEDTSGEPVPGDAKENIAKESIAQEDITEEPSQ